MNANVIDIEGLRRLSGNDEAFVAEILKLFAERATKDTEELATAQKTNDWSTIRFVVHRMRSAAVPLGLKDLVILLKKVEMEIKEETFGNINSYLEQIFTITKMAVEDAQLQIQSASA